MTHLQARLYLLSKTLQKYWIGYVLVPKLLAEGL
mgnify:CR=1 FL=1